jgi:hypothetical protein
MSNRLIGLLIGAVLLVCAAVPGAAAAAKVIVRVEGATQTLVAQKTVTTTSKAVVKDGNPAHSCSGTSAAGALEKATKGQWRGGWSDGLGYFVQSIKGETPAGSSFFSFWLNGRLSTTGLCGAELKNGDRVLLFVDRCDFDAATGGCKNPPVLPLAVRLPSRVHLRRATTVTVVRFDAAGRSAPVPGATVYQGPRRIGKTNSKGKIKVRFLELGRRGVRATKAGFARSTRVRVRVVA